MKRGAVALLLHGDRRCNGVVVAAYKEGAAVAPMDQEGERCRPVRAEMNFAVPSATDLSVL